MAKKKQEDNRDIFEKALDYGAPMAGAVIGGALASRFNRGALKRAKRSAKQADDEFQIASEKESRRPGMLIRSSREFDEAESKMLVRDANYAAEKAKRARNVVIGSGLGGAAGYKAADSERKRRK